MVEYKVDTQLLCSPSEAAERAWVYEAVGWTVVSIGQCTTPEGLRWFVAVRREVA